MKAKSVAITFRFETTLFEPNARDLFSKAEKRVLEPNQRRYATQNHLMYSIKDGTDFMSAPRPPAPKTMSRASESEQKMTTSSTWLLAKPCEITKAF